VSGSVVSPPLPAPEVVHLADRGEFFVRQVPGPAGSIPCLLIHGWQATADLNFFSVFEPLGQHHRVIAADLRGHGRSAYPEETFTLEAAADDNAALLESLSVQRAIVVGYSIGSAVAQILVDRHPSLVAGLVLAGGELLPDRRRREKLVQRLGGWTGTLQRLSEGRRGAHLTVTRAKRTNPSVESLRSWIVTELERGHPGSIRAAGRALGRFDGSAIAAGHRPTTPVATVVATHDKLVHPDRQRRLTDAWGAHPVILDADHDAPIACPVRFADAILAAVDHIERNIVPVAARAVPATPQNRP
jgi:pimeloyl-ACP methyl ester carboxylesterase